MPARAALSKIKSARRPIHFFFEVRHEVGSVFALSAALAAITQPAAPDHPPTDATKIADALRGGHFLAKDATLIGLPLAGNTAYCVRRRISAKQSCRK